MVRRRCRFIVISDGTRSAFAFEAGNAVRKILIDPAPIHFHKLEAPGAGPRRQRHRMDCDYHAIARSTIRTPTAGPMSPTA